MVSGEAIQSQIKFLMKEDFSSSCAVVFLRFLPSNTPITQYYSFWWWIFPFQGSRWKLYRAQPKKLTRWLYQLTVAFSDTSDGVHRQHVTQLNAVSTPERNDGSMFRPLSHVDERNQARNTATIGKRALSCSIFRVKSSTHFQLMCLPSQKFHELSVCGHTSLFSKLGKYFPVCHHFNRVRT